MRNGTRFKLECVVEKNGDVCILDNDGDTINIYKRAYYGDADPIKISNIPVAAISDIREPVEPRERFTLPNGLAVEKLRPGDVCEKWDLFLTERGVCREATITGLKLSVPDVQAFMYLRPVKP